MLLVSLENFLKELENFFILGIMVVAIFALPLVVH